ncbi:hypothetical protein AB7M56_005485 [Bradyrhizobium elkanii]
MPARSERIPGSAVSGVFSFNVTCCGPVTSTAATESRSALMFDFASLRLRSRLNLTASASSGVPSWKVMPARMLSTSVVGSVNFQLSARPGFGFSVSNSHSVSVSYIVNRKAWSEPAPPVAGSRLDGLAGAEMRKVPPFFGGPSAKARPPSVVLASAPEISAITSRRVVIVMAGPPLSQGVNLNRLGGRLAAPLPLAGEGVQFLRVTIRTDLIAR